jgi:hypothetical protein
MLLVALQVGFVSPVLPKALERTCAVTLKTLRLDFFSGKACFPPEQRSAPPNKRLHLPCCCWCVWWGGCIQQGTCAAAPLRLHLPGSRAPRPKPRLPEEVGTPLRKTARAVRGGARPPPPAPGAPKAKDWTRCLCAARSRSWRSSWSLVGAPQVFLDSGVGGAGVDEGQARVNRFVVIAPCPRRHPQPDAVLLSRKPLRKCFVVECRGQSPVSVSVSAPGRGSRL